MRVWKIAPGKYASNWEEALEKGQIFIGWPQMGDLSQYKSQEDLVDYYQEEYEVLHNPINNSFTLWGFTHLIQPGDVVIANKGGKSIVGIGKVTGEYEYMPEGNPEFPNVRKVDWVITQEIPLTKKQFPNKTLAEVSVDRLESIRTNAFKKVPNIGPIWKELFETTTGPNDGHPESKTSTDFFSEFWEFTKSRGFSFDRELIVRFATSLMSKPFLILSGISGTGKTKIAQLFAEFMTQQTPKRPNEVSSGILNFEYELKPYNFSYTRLMIPTAIVKQLEQLELDFSEGETVTIRYGNATEEALIKRQGGTVRLGFRKGLASWVSNHFKIDDVVYIQIQNDGTDWEFSVQPYTGQASVPQQYAFLSVRPDWLDHRGLLGGYNPLTETYQVSEMLKILLRAQRALEHPFFVILDEMNLAKVEYYFSDFLSCLESRLFKDGTLQQEAIQLHQADAEVEQGLSFVDEDGSVYQIPKSIKIPHNLYFIGTVNVDETTYMFSPKVLDRAHVIECNTIDFASYRQEVASSIQRRYEPRLSYTEKVEFFTMLGEFHKALYAKTFLRGNTVDRLQSAFVSADSL
ncbi:hypothetical protein [Tumebacillus permanentifrigoris]|uniref:Dynein-related subfamily AAA family protein n=1 Tax=Tumebacillus permanentifrigoris TaxID=378543 RepID=A0A316DBD9_9BACL|nr:hypothetical protein [Tumebacillus permanentifrigoris]PWK14402.1 hypothetical protein C7459_105159 [Tumebacillus permanentifrigoris]